LTDLVAMPTFYDESVGKNPEAPSGMKYILSGQDVDLNAPLGGKAKSLVILKRIGAPVPDWFVVSPAAFFDSLSSDQKEDFASRIFPTMELLPEVLTEIHQAMSVLCPEQQQVAVRSSALEEDGIHHSFAGQFSSFLCVPSDQVVQKIIEVWRSGFTEQAMAYRKQIGMGGIPIPPAVLIQRMVHASAAGVAFGADPVTGDPTSVIISAVKGLGDVLVSGECNAETVSVDSDNNVQRIETPGTAACLDEAKIRLIAQWVRYLSKRLGYPQDVEWALVNNTIHILQTRPITTLLQREPNEYFYYWDNDNIDSWPGVTTPLTFSFLRPMFAAKFEYLSRVLGAPEAQIVANQPVFQRSIGLIQGRVYYSVTALEQIWGAIPWFKRYRAQFECLMGQPDSYSNVHGSPPPPERWFQFIQSHIPIALSLGQLAKHYLHWPKRVEQFFKETRQALSATTVLLEKMTIDQLVLQYRQLEPTLLMLWSVPSVNNFMATFFYALLGSCTKHWCGDSDEAMGNDLLHQEGAILSAEPIRELKELARFLLKTPDLADVLCQESLENIEQAIREAPEFHYRYQQYLQRYGERCYENLKLESPNLVDMPLSVFRSIGHLAKRLAQNPWIPEFGRREHTESQVQKMLAGHPIRKRLFAWVLQHARQHIRDRENMRFMQSLVIGRLKTLFKHLGERFKTLDLLDSAEDIFYLELQEVLGYVEGTTTCQNLGALAVLRKAEFEAFQMKGPLPECFETRSSSCLGDITSIFYGNEVVRLQAKTDETPSSEANAQHADVEDKNAFVGLSCCSGTVSGHVRIVGPASIDLVGGEILVAAHGDPGLVMLFPMIAGLLLENGNPLSHLAIVAREMGVPTISSIPNITRFLRDGDWVQMDGRTGLIQRIRPEADS
jgi:rifampicin phosphotransferase